MQKIILTSTIALFAAWLLGSKVYQMRRMGPSGYGFRSTALEVASKESSKNQNVALITGATSGLGLESAKALASIGTTVLIGGRTMSKAHDAMDRVILELGSKKKLNLVPIRCSLGSLREAEDCANTTIKLLSMIERKLDILMLNAGVAWVPEHRETEDGFEFTMAVNHLNQVHLTNNLMNYLSSSARVVVDWKSEKRPWLVGAPAYGDSKLANCVFARALHHHRHILAFSVHPGEILTNILKPQDGWWPWILNFFGRLIEPFFLKSAEQGAATQVYCALQAPSYTSGKYFQDCNEAPYESEDITEKLNNETFTKRFMEISENLIRGALDRVPK